LLLSAIVTTLVVRLRGRLAYCPPVFLFLVCVVNVSTLNACYVLTFRIKGTGYLHFFYRSLFAGLFRVLSLRRRLRSTRPRPATFCRYDLLVYPPVRTLLFRIGGEFRESAKRGQIAIKPPRNDLILRQQQNWIFAEARCPFRTRPSKTDAFPPVSRPGRTRVSDGIRVEHEHKAYLRTKPASVTSTISLIRICLHSTCQCFSSRIRV